MNDIYPSIENWMQRGEELARQSDDLKWQIGQWVVDGERQFGDDIYQAIGEDNYHKLMQMKWVYLATSGQRNPNLSWTHHRLVASLDRDVQKTLLCMAEDNNWSSRQLQDEVRTLKKPAEYTYCEYCGSKIRA